MFVSSGLAALLLFELLALAPPLNALPSRSTYALWKRQGSTPLIPPADIPLTCQSQCGIISTLAACTTPTCGCTNANGQQLLVCLNCIVTATSASQPIVNSIQNDLNNVVQDCQNAGVPINSLTLNGGGSSGLPSPPPNTQPPTDTPTDTNPNNGTDGDIPDQGGDGITSNGTTSEPPLGESPPIISNGNETSGIPGVTPAQTSSPEASATSKPNSADSLRVGSFASILLPLLGAQIFIALV